MYVYLQIFIRFLNVVFQLDSCILGPIVIVFSYSSFQPSLLNVSRVCNHCPFTITYNIRFITILWKLILTLQYTIHTHQTHTTRYSNSPLFPPPSFYSLLLPSTHASFLLLPPPFFYSRLLTSTPSSFLLLPPPTFYSRLLPSTSSSSMVRTYVHYPNMPNFETESERISPGVIRRKEGWCSFGNIVFESLPLNPHPS